MVTGDTEEQIAAAAARRRKQIAFYGSTPAYRRVLELHGWGDLQTELNTLSKQGEWDEMGRRIDDDDPRRLRRARHARGDPRRCSGSASATSIDRISLYMPYAGEAADDRFDCGSILASIDGRR